VSPVVGETLSKKASVVWALVSGVNGAKHQSVKRSSLAVVSALPLILDRVMAVRELVRVTLQKRKCASSKPVRVLASGASGQPARLHVAMESNRDRELATVNSISIVWVVPIIKLLVPRRHAQIVDGVIIIAGMVTQVAVIVGILEAVQALGTAGAAIAGILKPHNQLKLQLTITHGLIYSAVTVICSVLTLATTSSKQIKGTIFTKGDNKIKTPGNMFLAKSKNSYHTCLTHK